MPLTSRKITSKHILILLAIGVSAAISGCAWTKDKLGMREEQYVGGKRPPSMNPGGNGETDIASTLPISTASMKASDDTNALNPTPYDTIGTPPSPTPSASSPNLQRKRPMLNDQAMEEVQGGGVVDAAPISPVQDGAYPALASIPSVQDSDSPTDDSLQKRFDALMAERAKADANNMSANNKSIPAEAPKTLEAQPPIMAKNAEPQTTPPPPPSSLPALASASPAPASQVMGKPLDTPREPITNQAWPSPHDMNSPAVQPANTASASVYHEPIKLIPPSAPEHEPITLVPPAEVASVPDNATPLTESSGEPIILKQPAGSGMKYRLLKDSRYSDRRIADHHSR